MIDHYEQPRNVGKLDGKKKNVGTGLVGAPACGDVMKLQVNLWIWLMPSPSAFPKVVLSVLKFLDILKFLRYTQNILGTLKWANLCREI